MASRKATTRKVTTKSKSKAENLEVPGFRFAGIHCGIKAKTRDLGLVAMDPPATVAAVFTQSTVVGAPVEWCRDRMKAGVAQALAAKLPEPPRKGRFQPQTWNLHWVWVLNSDGTLGDGGWQPLRID